MGTREETRFTTGLVEKALQGDERAALAVDVFCYRIKKYIGMYAAVLGQLDAVVFTGGIGENAGFVREEIGLGLDALGIQFDSQRNEQADGFEGEISSPESRVKVLVIPTDEERAIAGDTYELATQVAASA